MGHTGLLTIAGALSYGELAAMMPLAGGMYVYLREAFRRSSASFTLTLLSVIQTGSIAAVAIAFARFSAVPFPSISESHYLIAPVALLPGYALSLSTAQALAIGIILLTTAINAYGVEWGKLNPERVTVAKLSGIVALLAIGGGMYPHPAVLHANFARPWQARDVANRRDQRHHRVRNVHRALACRRQARCFPPIRGTTSRLLRAKCGTRGAICRSRSASGRAW